MRERERGRKERRKEGRYEGRKEEGKEGRMRFHQCQFFGPSRMGKILF
jgi:hypothetical protein